jgi:hypothetical protein
MAVASTLLNRDKTSGKLSAVMSLVFSGSYATGGETLDLAPLVGFTNKQPTIVRIQGIAGYTYSYDAANKKIKIFNSSPGGLLSQPSFTVLAGTIIAGGGLGLDAASVAGRVVGGTAITTNLVLTTTSPVGTPTFTATASGLAELSSASYPSGVTGDTVLLEAVWYSGVGVAI